MTGTANRGLVRGVGVRGAVAINVITMIGIGPLITIPLVLRALHGPLSLAGWIAGALLALCDGLVWAELGSRFPGSGGTYGFLREAFGRDKLGRLLAFLFVWQTIFSAPLLLATGYIGFASYAGYFSPALAANANLQGAVAIAVGIVTLVALYRGIAPVARFATWLGAAAIVALLCVVAGGFAHFAPARAFALGGDAFWPGLAAGFGQALIITMYDYFGYGAASCVGDEVREPSRTLPRAIVISILLVAALYVAMQVGVLGAMPWQTIVAEHGIGQFIGSAIVEHAFGVGAAAVVTVLILVTAFGSVFGNLLAFSRIPFAAATDGIFPRAFARVHPRGRFPHVSLLVIGILALPACLLPLDIVINALTAGMVLIQSVAQIGALFLGRARGERAPYRMWLFPLPALVALAGWLFAFSNAGTWPIVFGVLTLVCGSAAYLASAKRSSSWPFPSRSPDEASLATT
ncbi:MAG TPA: APC family permease [Candidatus Elarobacter sp.]